jgi:hypothetical protein
MSRDFRYKIVVDCEDSTFATLFDKATELAGREGRYVEISTTGKIFYFAENKAAIAFVLQCKIRAIPIKLENWPVSDG